MCATFSYASSINTVQMINPVFILATLTRPTHRRTDANLYPPERQLTKASEPSFDLEGEAKGQI